MCSVEIQIQNIDSIAHDLGQLHLCDGGHRIFFFFNGMRNDVEFGQDSKHADNVV